MRVLLKGSFYLLALLLLSNTGWAETTDTSSWRQIVGYLNPRGWPFIPVPEIGTDPNGGTTVGILPVFLFVDEHQQVNRIVNGDLTYNSTLGVGGGLQILSYPSEDIFWSATASAAERIARTVDLFYSNGLRRENRWSFEGRLLFDRDPTERFFGVGNHTGSGDETNYTLEQESLIARVGLNLSQQTQLALDLRPRLVDIRRGAFDSLDYVGKKFPQLPGLQRGSNEFVSRLLLSYDTRNSLNVPTTGTFLSVWGGITDQQFLSSVSYSMFGFEGRHYLPLSSRFTLASHLAMRYMPVGRQVPFWALSRLGGDRSEVGFQQPLRGFGAGRFVDRNLFAANAELRTRVLERDIFGTHAILELAPFIDVGRVFHHMDDNPLGGLHPVGGVGFRGIAAPFVVGYVDVGYGGEGVAFFSGVNYPF